MRALERAEAEMAAGRLWKARDRLQGAFVTEPANPRVLELLGHVLYEMGDLPEAARYWVMADIDGEAFDRAFAALLERHGDDLALVARVIPVRAKVADLPPRARARLATVRAAAEARWGKHVDLGWERRPKDRIPEAPRTWRTKLAEAVAAMVAISIAAVLFIGVVAIGAAGLEVIVSWFD